LHPCHFVLVSFSVSQPSPTNSCGSFLIKINCHCN
jgi:hypothetical protein